MIIHIEISGWALIYERKLDRWCLSTSNDYLSGQKFVAKGRNDHYNDCFYIIKHLPQNKDDK